MSSSDVSTPGTAPRTVEAGLVSLARSCADCPGCPGAEAALRELAMQLGQLPEGEGPGAHPDALLAGFHSCATECPNQAAPGALERELPELVLDLAADRFSRGGASRAELWYSGPDRVGTLLHTLPRPLRRLAGSSLGRWIGALLLGARPRKGLRPAPTHLFRELAAERSPSQSAIAEAEVGFFYTCQADYVEPSVGTACVETLERHGVNVLIPPQSCCGLAALHLGDREGAADQARRSIEGLLPFATVGTPIVVASPSCAEMLRVHAPRLLGTPMSSSVARAVTTWSTYLERLRKASPEAAEILPAPACRVACVMACSGSAEASASLLNEVPGFEVVSVKACSGIHDPILLDSGDATLWPALLDSGLEVLRQQSFENVVAECRHAARSLELVLRRPVPHPAELLQTQYQALLLVEPAEPWPSEAPGEDVLGLGDVPVLETVLERQRTRESKATASLLRRPAVAAPEPADLAGPAGASAPELLT